MHLDARVPIWVGVENRGIGRLAEISRGSRLLRLHLFGGPLRERVAFGRTQRRAARACRVNPGTGNVRTRSRGRLCTSACAGGRGQESQRHDEESLRPHERSSLPSANTTLRSLPIRVPRRPGLKVTVTTSPTFSDLLVQPRLAMFGGDPSSSSQRAFLSSTDAIPTSTWGFVHVNSVMVTFSVVSALTS